ncbi:hypothetical protein [Nocardiopsis synnemataformans]|uniref:hypothetical protein n=1 Tax=Nocardiopsis synnemataformans TaxID=61305 RepID=UPI003EB94733
MVLTRTTPPRPRLHTTPLALSITVDDALPRRRPMRIRHLPGGHCLITIRTGLECGHVARLYQYKLRGPARRLVYRAFEVPDPDIDLEGYARLVWWDPDWAADVPLLEALEQRGLLTPWPHGATLPPARFRA